MIRRSSRGVRKYVPALGKIGPQYGPLWAKVVPSPYAKGHVIGDQTDFFGKSQYIIIGANGTLKGDFDCRSAAAGVDPRLNMGALDAHSRRGKDYPHILARNMHCTSKKETQQHWRGTVICSPCMLDFDSIQVSV